MKHIDFNIYITGVEQSNLSIISKGLRGLLDNLSKQEASRTRNTVRNLEIKLWRHLKQGEVIKAISQTLEISQNTLQSIIWKWKECGRTADIIKHSHLSTLTGQARRSISREAPKRFMVTLEKSCCQFNTRHIGDTANMWCFGQIRWTLNLLAYKQNVMCGRNLTLHINPNTASRYKL